MSLDKIDLIDRKFPQSLLGYRRDDVDRLMSEAAEAIGRLAEEKMTLARTVEALRREIGEYQGREATLRDTLLTTQRIVEKLKTEARKEAARILDEARDKASGLIREAEERVAVLQRDADALVTRRGQLVDRFREMLLASLDVLDARDAAPAGDAGGAAVATEDFVFNEPAFGQADADNQAFKDHGAPEPEFAG